MEVARLEEARQSRGVAAVADEAIEIGGGLACFAGVGSWANQAMGVGMQGPVDPDEIDRMIEFYESRGVEPRIEVCPLCDPTLTDGLAERGFVVRAFENVLVFDLRQTAIPAPPAGIEGVELDPADERQLERFIDVIIRGFRPDDPAGFGRMERRVVTAPNCTSYLAVIDGEAVAAGSCECAPPAGALFGMTTLETHRGRGCQQALMIARLQAAHRAGCRQVCVNADPRIATGRNALRLGFQVAYTKAILVRPGEGLVPSP